MPTPFEENHNRHINESWPKVSVIVPNYNHARFLRKRLQSVLDQTYQDFEILYLDDASTDQSAQVFAGFEANLRIRAILNSHNTGIPFKQWNRGVREARGEYIWIAEADDYADPTLLATLVAQLDANPEAGLAFCQSWIVDQDDVKNGLEQGGWFIAPEQWKRDFSMQGRDYACQFMALDNTIPNASAVVFRKAVYETAGYANEKLRLSGDWMMWHQMLQRADIVFVAQPLNFFRAHEGSVRVQSDKVGVSAEERYIIARFIMRHWTLSVSQIEQLLHHSIEFWREALFAPGAWRDWRRHRRILRIARSIDHQLGPRLVRHISYRLLRNSRFFEVARAVGRKMLCLAGRE